MPTASAHIAAALELLQDPAFIPRKQLASGELYGAFLLGNISPDVRVLNGAAREATHFYDIPLSGEATACQTMFAVHPSLENAGALAEQQAAFVAGYMAHLILDETWLELVVMPHIFVDGATWNKNHPNFLLYCLLMTLLAEESGLVVPQIAVDALLSANPRSWLPFANDADLSEWRDRVSRYVQNDSGWQTARMFAYEMKVDAEDLHQVVTSEDLLDKEIFKVVPRSVLDTFQHETHRRTVEALNAYLSVWSDKAGFAA